MDLAFSPAVIKTRKRVWAACSACSREPGIVPGYLPMRISHVFRTQNQALKKILTESLVQRLIKTGVSPKSNN